MISLFLAGIVLTSCTGDISNTNIAPQVLVDGTDVLINELEAEVSHYESTSLSNEDLYVVSDEFFVDRDMTEKDIIDKLGYPKNFYYDNYGYISSENGMVRWQLDYFKDNESDIGIRVLLLSEQGDTRNDMDRYINTNILGIYLHSVDTSRGIRVGDTKEKLFKTYGKPDIIRRYSANNEFIEIIYKGNTGNIRFTLDEKVEKIEYILIDYAGDELFGN